MISKLTDRFKNSMFSLLLICGVTFSTFPAQADVTAFTHVNVIPMDSERVLPDQTVLVRDGTVVAVGETGSIAIPRNAQKIEASGKYLLPGLADMHAHISSYAGEDAIGENFEVAQSQLLMYAATGVTLLRDTSGSPSHETFRQRLAGGEWIGPELYYTSPVLEGERAVWDFAKKVTDVAEAERLVREYAENGYWGIKVYHTLSKEVYTAIIKAGKRYGIPVIGHVPFEVGIDAALRSGQYSIEHYRGYDFDGVPEQNLWIDGGRTAERFGSWLKMSDQRMADLVAATVVNGVWNVPTLAVNRLLFDAPSRKAVTEHPRFQRVHKILREQMVGSNALDEIFSLESRQALGAALPRMLDLTRALNEAGAGLMIGTDAVIPAYVPGFTPIDELKSFVEAGLSNYQALRTATVAPAKFLHQDDRLGSVAVGKVANLILVESNPLENLEALWNLSGVMLHGKWHTLAELERKMEQMAEQ